MWQLNGPFLYIYSWIFHYSVYRGEEWRDVVRAGEERREDLPPNLRRGTWREMMCRCRLASFTYKDAVKSQVKPSWTVVLWLVVSTFLKQHVLQLHCEVSHPSMAHQWSIDQPFNLVLGIFDYCLGLKLVLVRTFRVMVTVSQQQRI